MARSFMPWHSFVAWPLVVSVGRAFAAQVDLIRRAGAPTPVVVEASQQWEGNDGPWSSFVLQVGTPVQQVRVFVSIGGQETWVVLPEGCPDSAPNVNECPDVRGGLFTINASSSWESTTSIWNNTGYYSLETLVLRGLGIDGNGEYGFDTVGTSFNGGGGVTLNHTIVAGIATPNFYLGQFGISPRPTNFTVENGNSSSFTDPQPSFFSLLRSNNMIPSLSYGFTAGSYYRSKSVKNALGSMIFGGYDASLNGSSSVSFDFADNTGRELVVAIQSITKSVAATDTDLLPSSIFAALDSSQPNIWLPVEACQKFEDAFGIFWNATAELYILNSTVHDSLLKENANVTFRVGNTVSGGPVADIVFPYNSFDLTASWPLTSDSQSYFPLKRAANETQYTLGRTFLQEAYLIANYEQNKFQLSQRTWQDGVEQKIVTIPSANSTDENSDSNGFESKDPALSVGAIVGIVVGGLVLLGLVALLYIRHRRRHRSITESPDKPEYSHLQPDLANEFQTRGTELPSDSSQLFEMDPGKSNKVELYGDQEHRAEIHGVQQLAEMDGSKRRSEAYELPGSQDDRRYELP